MSKASRASRMACSYSPSAIDASVTALSARPSACRSPEMRRSGNNARSARCASRFRPSRWSRTASSRGVPATADAACVDSTTDKTKTRKLIVATISYDPGRNTRPKQSAPRRPKNLFHALVPLVTPYGEQLTLVGRIGAFARGGAGIQRRGHVRWDPCSSSEPFAFSRRRHFGSRDVSHPPPGSRLPPPHLSLSPPCRFPLCHPPPPHH